MKPAWFVYVARCADDSLYTGVTTDLERRQNEHNSSTLGAKYTKARRPVTFIHTETYRDRSQAQKREAVIKKLSREQKLHWLQTCKKRKNAT